MKRPKSVHYILSITRANAVANVIVLSGEYFILRWVQYTGYFITGEDYQCDDMWITCRRGNLKSTMGRVVRKYNVKFLSEGRSKSDCTFFVELWRSIVSEVCVSCAQEICTQSSECKVCVTVSDGRYKSHCTVWSWVTYNGECVSIALKSSVRKVLNVKFVSRGQFALADKISRGCSTILNFQRHFLCVKQLISRQTNFWYRFDNTSRII